MFFRAMSSLNHITFRNFKKGEKMKIENLTDERYNEELEAILKEKGIISDGIIFIGFDFDDMTFKSVEEMNEFIDSHCTCLRDDNFTYFVYRRSAIGKDTYPDDYNVARVRNEDVYTPE